LEYAVRRADIPGRTFHTRGVSGSNPLLPTTFTMWDVYILRSSKNGRYHIGSAGSVAQRLHQHNAGLVTATRYLRPLRVIYAESFPDRVQAYKRERWLKRVAS